MGLMILLAQISAVQANSLFKESAECPCSASGDWRMLLRAHHCCQMCYWRHHMTTEEHPGHEARIAKHLGSRASLDPSVEFSRLSLRSSLPGGAAILLK